MPDQAPAQITYTTNPLLSPMAIGGLVLLAANICNLFGIHVLDDPAMQAKLVGSIDTIIVLGMAFAHVMWPHQDGRLSFSAPLSTPAPQDVPAGASVVTVPAPKDETQVTDVQPLDVGRHTVQVTPPTPAQAPGLSPLPPSVTVTSAGR